jgi:hypothetical protein
MDNVLEHRVGFDPVVGWAMRVSLVMNCTCEVDVRVHTSAMLWYCGSSVETPSPELYKALNHDGKFGAAKSPVQDEGWSAWLVLKGQRPLARPSGPSASVAGSAAGSVLA